MSESREPDPLYIDHLEPRRAAFDQSMWQAPALTIAAQAFLLRVITDRSINYGARALVLAAGALACGAAFASLLRLRAREVRFSGEIARLLGWGEDPWLRRPLDEPKARLLSDKRLRQSAARWKLPVYLLWCAALLVFVAADVVALIATA